MKQHKYSLTVNWTGNKGESTNGYKSYERSHEIIIEGKEIIKSSSDPAFLGDKTKHNPEDLLLASISSCHMLWYLHLCSDEGIIITNYIDNARGIMTETSDGGGKFTPVTLYPTISLKDITQQEKANALHSKANELCFIANSLNFKVVHKATFISELYLP
jgi:organic hydroperoxide reductase OsmC/OhrA